MSLYSDLTEVLTPYANKINELNGSLETRMTLATSRRTVIPDGTDIDTVLTPGEYKIGTLTHANTMANLPYVIAGTLTVSSLTSNGFLMQAYRTASARSIVYTRFKISSGTAWGDWRRMIYDDDFASASINVASKYTNISEYTDLDTITTPGEYKVTTASIAGTLINSPLLNVGYNLRVLGLVSESTICQIVIGANNNLRMYARFGVNGTYSEWKLISFDVDTDEILNAVGALGVNVTKNTARIVTLENAAGISGEYLTAYTTEEQALYDKVNNDIDNNTLVFVVSADNHYRETTNGGSNQVYYAEIMAKMAKRLRADAIINLGDIITQYVSSIDDPVYAGTGITPSEINTRRLAKMASAFQSTGVPFLYTIAHHEMYLDSNGPTSTNHTTQTSVYPYPETKVLGLCGKGAEWIEEHHYTQDALSAGYYVDFDRQKVRVIFYDSVGYTACGYTPASIAFITEAFATVPAGYKVIVCTHVASRAPGVYSATIKNWEQVEAIMQNFTSNGGTILGELHGHSHFDNIVKIEGVPYPYICICCAENSWSTVGEKIEAGVLGNPVSYKYHASKYGAIGTYNEWLFDVVCVHPDRDTINLFRFGIGEDRTVSLSET